MYIVDDSDFMHPHIVKVDDDRIEQSAYCPKNMSLYTYRRGKSPKTKYVYAAPSEEEVRILWNARWHTKIEAAETELRNLRSRLL